MAKTQFKAASLGNGSTYDAPAGTSGLGKPPKTTKPVRARVDTRTKAQPKAKPTTTGPLVKQTRTLEHASAMY
jgi:hypothetical protein